MLFQQEIRRVGIPTLITFRLSGDTRAVDWCFVNPVSSGHGVVEVPGFRLNV